MFDTLFPLPDDVFQLGLKAGNLLIYTYLQYQKGARSRQCYPSHATIGKAVGVSRKTVQKHISALVDKGLIQAENTTVRWKKQTHLITTICSTRLNKPIHLVIRKRQKEFLAGLKLAEAQRKWGQQQGTAIYGQSSRQSLPLQKNRRKFAVMDCTSVCKEKILRIPLTAPPVCPSAPRPSVHRVQTGPPDPAPLPQRRSIHPR